MIHLFVLFYSLCACVIMGVSSVIVCIRWLVPSLLHYVGSKKYLFLVDIAFDAVNILVLFQL